MTELLTKGIKGVYEPHSNSMERGYTFHIVLTDKVVIRGENLKTPEERDEVANDIAKELGIILTT